MLQKEVSSIRLSNGDGPGSNGTEIPVSEPPAVETHEPPSPPDRDPYRGVVIVLLQEPSPAWWVGSRKDSSSAILC